MVIAPRCCASLIIVAQLHSLEASHRSPSGQRSKRFKFGFTFRVFLQRDARTPCQSIRNHDRGKKHIEVVAEFFRKKREDKLKGAKSEDDLKKQMEEIEKVISVGVCNASRERPSFFPRLGRTVPSVFVSQEGANLRSGYIAVVLPVEGSILPLATPGLAVRGPGGPEGSSLMPRVLKSLCVT